jgi:hypothetical protein
MAGEKKNYQRPSAKYPDIMKRLGYDEFSAY